MVNRVVSANIGEHLNDRGNSGLKNYRVENDLGIVDEKSEKE